MREPEIRAVTPPSCDLGEGPVWRYEDGSLSWVDITACQVHTVVGDGPVSTVTLDRPVGAIAPTDSGEWIAAAGAGFLLLHADGATTELAQPEHGNPDVRMNDGKCDPRGRFWAGSMSGTRERAGALYRLDHDLSVTKVLDGVGISNGIGWSPDGRAMYYVDSAAGTLDVFDFDLDDGVPTRRRTLAVIEPPAVPDGLAVDDSGAIWVALWDGGQVRRYTPEGVLDTAVPLPVSRPTSCCFGGADGRTLYITSASVGVDRAAEPLAGAVFAHTASTGGPVPHRLSIGERR